MKTRFVLTLLSAAALLGAASAYAQPSKSQAGGLPALAAEVAALRAMVEDLQSQNPGDPYAGTFAVTLVETSLFGCRPANPPPPPVYVPQYFLPLNSSSVSIRSASFDVEADGSTLHVPEFELLTQELRLSGKYDTDTRIEDALQLVIGGDGSLHADFGDTQVSGQFAQDGSMFSALVVGSNLNTPAGGCQDVWTVNLTGVRK